MNTIGNRLRYFRKANKLTLKAIHEATGISTGNLSDIENNKVIPSGKTLLTLKNEYNLSADWLLSGSTVNNNIRNDEKEVLLNYNKLDYINRKLAISELKHMYEVQELKKE
ncbi:helix-turn-helix domain-containing protein [Vallitalea guaymasensis]|uniref:Helix-turn-helix transcriptional regulator n=1 Tax=Vallitalea guaymasensis TaxID=1185412 RepID=A0A8J8MB24_9FIRM|nr:helix-turn-helix transcriptional regulator [Vallitalea guaymasensis]QUH29569.1 helix-turn-helix transcriptional regulator [Vallitalea guaymasensis]